MRGETNTKLANIGNDFIVPSSRLTPVMQAAIEAPMPTHVLQVPLEVPRAAKTVSPYHRSRKGSFIDLLHDHSVIVFAFLVMLVGIAVIEFGTSYIMNHDFPVQVSSLKNATSSIGGLNKTLSASNLAGFMSSLTSQPATLNLGSKSVTIPASTISSWLSLTTNKTSNEDYIHIDASNISSSLLGLVNQYVTSPLNQVTITRSDGTSEVAIGGKNGTKLDPSVDLGSQSVGIAKNLFSNKGFNVNAPLVTVPYQSVTPAAFSKLIVVDLNSKRMYLYQNSELINTYLVSAGKPSTPTPIGEFHIWDKTTNQTMVGPGYVQPNVPYINYFDHSGDAIHGVYWRPASVFGNVNTSHGCVGVPVSTAEYIYNWAPIGTTVITTPN